MPQQQQVSEQLALWEAQLRTLHSCFQLMARRCDLASERQEGLLVLCSVLHERKLDLF